MKKNILALVLYMRSYKFLSQHKICQTNSYNPVNYIHSCSMYIHAVVAMHTIQLLSKQMN